MVVYGGYDEIAPRNFTEASCDEDRIFLLDLSSLSWQSPTNTQPDGREYEVPSLVTQAIGGK